MSAAVEPRAPLPEHLDALREIASMGAGHAATALSELTGSAVEIDVPVIEVAPLATVHLLVTEPEACAAAIYVEVVDGACAGALLMLPADQAQTLVQAMLGMPCETFDELATSALAETGNVLISSFVNAVGDATGLTLAVTPPSVALGMAGAILESVIAASQSLDDQVLAIHTRLCVRGRSIDGSFWLLPDPESLALIVSALGMPY